MEGREGRGGEPGARVAPVAQEGSRAAGRCEDARGDRSATADAGAARNPAGRPGGGEEGGSGPRLATAGAAASQGARQDAGGGQAEAADPQQRTLRADRGGGAPAKARQTPSDQPEATAQGMEAPAPSRKPGVCAARQGHASHGLQGGLQVAGQEAGRQGRQERDGGCRGSPKPGGPPRRGQKRAKAARGPKPPRPRRRKAPGKTPAQAQAQAQAQGQAQAQAQALALAQARYGYLPKEGLPR